MKARSRLATLVAAGATVSSLALAPGIAAAAPPLPPGGIFVCLGGIPGQNGCPQQPSLSPGGTSSGGTSLGGASVAQHVPCSDHLNAPWVAIYKDINFGGQCDAYEGPGKVVLPSGVADTASSINIGANGRFLDNQGASLPFQYGLQIADLRTIGWNDRVEGVQIDGTPGVQPPAIPNPPDWLTNLSENDLLNCTISMVGLAAGIEEASGAEMPALVHAIDDLGSLGDYETFFKTLQGDPYWNAALLKATANFFYEPFRACFMGVQGALQGTAGAAGKAVGQWLRSVIITRQTSGG
jgi:hypothetical protein